MSSNNNFESDGNHLKADLDDLLEKLAWAVKKNDKHEITGAEEKLTEMRARFHSKKELEKLLYHEFNDDGFESYIQQRCEKIIGEDLIKKVFGILEKLDIYTKADGDETRGEDVIVLDFVDENNKPCGSTTVREAKFTLDELKPGSRIPSYLVFSKTKDIAMDDYIVQKYELIEGREPTRYKVHVKKK